MRDCEICKGTGVRIHAGFTALDGTVYPERRYTCRCNNGKFPELNKGDIEKSIVVTRKGKTSLRASPPDVKRFGNLDGSRIYYVWRLARFHGGKDMTMPIMAQTAVYGDPYLKELESLSDTMAKKYYGTDLAAAKAWMGVL